MSLAINKPSKNNEIMLALVRNVELAIEQLAEMGVTVLNADLMTYCRPVIWVNGREFRTALAVKNASTYFMRDGALHSTVNNLLFGCRIVWQSTETTFIH